MTRVIRIFDADDESFIKEVELSEIPLDLLRDLFELDLDNPMYDCYKITKKESNFFSDYSDLNFDFTRFEYFLEFDQ